MSFNAYCYWFSTLCLILSVASITYGERLHEQIYSSIEGGAACFRRLNGTHQAGCTSSDKGAVGVVHMIENVNDVQWMVYNGTAGPYIAVVSTAMFHSVVELLMAYPDNIAGVLLYDNSSLLSSSFTQESRCPNEYYSDLSSKCSSSAAGGIVWNEMGTELLRRDIPFPIFFLPESRIEEIDKIKKCYNRYNLDRDNQKGNPLCSLQLSSFMFAAVDSRVCMRRSTSSALFTANKVCDPLGDNNVYYSLFPRIKETSTSKKPVHLVTARIDTASLFDGVAPGAASSVVGMVTLVTAAAALSKMISVNDSHLYGSNVLWTLFNGEAFDYIGSQRVAYDMSRGAWPPGAPLASQDLKLHLELGQLGGDLLAHAHDTDWPLYAFAPTDTVYKITEFLEAMYKNTAPYNMTLSPQFTDNLPPSSLHSFRRILNNATSSGDLPELLIVDHANTFTNKFYHSVLDEYTKIGFVYHNISIGTDGTFIPTEELVSNGTMNGTEPQVKVARLATAVARSLYQQVTGQPYGGNLSVSAHLVDEMLYCFLRSHLCRLLSAADYMPRPSDDSPDRPPDSAADMSPRLYVGVSAYLSPPAVYVGHLLALLTGTHHNITREQCDTMDNPDFSYYYLKGWNHSGVCIETTMNFSQALSPAFIIPDYDFTSHVYSTWTESVWQGMWARVFVSAGGGGARAAGVAGAAATLLAAALALWLRKHRRLVFREYCAPAHTHTGVLRSVNC